MMTLWTQARIALVASVGLCTPSVVAWTQDDTDSSNGSESASSGADSIADEDEEASGFWGWVEENIPVEYPDVQSEGNQRPRSGGGGGDSGGGGGHGG